MQAAGGGVDLVRELAAGMQRGEDDLQRRLGREFRVRVDRDAAAVVADRHGVVGRQLQLDAAGVAGDRLVHGVVEHLGDQRSEEHTSELQSLMRISYAVLCLKKKTRARQKE